MGSFVMIRLGKLLTDEPRASVCAWTVVAEAHNIPNTTAALVRNLFDILDCVIINVINLFESDIKE